jgi:hypothetical protein
MRAFVDSIGIGRFYEGVCRLYGGFVEHMSGFVDSVRGILAQAHSLSFHIYTVTSANM